MVVHTSNPRENMTGNVNKNVNKKKKGFMVSQELKLVRILAGNNKTSRDRALKNLRRWFEQRERTMPFTDEDLGRIWKGLYYSMWMSDKPLIQEECAENISNLIHFTSIETSLRFFKAGLQILSSMWFGIDQLRLDKFLMLVRRLLRQSLVVLKNHKWNKKGIETYGDILSNTVLNTKAEPPLGLFMHFTEIFMEELSKISEGKLMPDRVTEFIKPFIKKLSFSKDGRQIAHIRKYVFTYLIRQSNLGLEYQEKYNVWKSHGFSGSIDAIQKVKVPNDELMSSDEEEEGIVRKPLDPRAGRVDVELPQIKFNAKEIANALTEVKYDKGTNTKSRKMLSVLSEQFTKLANGTYPLGIKKLKLPNNDQVDTNVRKAVNRLVKFEKKLMGKDNKKRKRAVEENEDEQTRNSKKQKVDQENEKTDKKLSKQPKEKTKKIITAVVKPSVKKKQLSALNINTELNQFRTVPIDFSKIECVFQRNSGTWVVMDETEKEKSNGDVNTLNLQVSPPTSPKKVLQPTTLFESPTKVDQTELFPKTEWDEPLQDGEYEICIPSRKFVGKMKKLAKEKNLLIKENFQNIKGKNRFSLDSKLGNCRTPGSSKKVKINTKLNKSQEVHEHHAQILSSPGIPFDANKKPSKPLLKMPKVSTPINPFYKQLNVW